MSIPKEPRQLMINLMYLVLTAMLALNVSAEIINAFFSLDKGIERTNKTVVKSSGKIAEDMAYVAKTKTQYLPLVETAKQLQEITKEFNAYIDGLRDRMVEESGGAYTLEEATANGHPELEGKPKGKKDKDTPQRIFVSGDYGGQGSKTPEGPVLMQKIMDTKAQYLALLKELWVSSPIEGTSFEDPNKQATTLDTLGADLTLGVDNEHEATGKSWEEFNFGHMPVAAVYPMLRKFQNDAQMTEIALINFLAKQMGTTSAPINSFEVVAFSPKSYIMLGEEYNAEIALGAFSDKGNIVGSVNGKKVPVKNGKAIYSAKPTSLGEKKYTASFNVKNPINGNNEVVKRDFFYEVGQRQIAVSANKMNVMYIGVENPITVAAAGIKTSNLSVTASNGTSLKSTGGGKFIATAKKIGPTTVNVKDKSNGKSFPFTFRVKRIPDPVVRLGKKQDGIMKSGAFRAQGGLIPWLDNFDFGARCTIQSYTLYWTRKREDPVELTGTRGKFTGKIKNAILAAKPGDQYAFVNVRARCPGDIAARQVNGLSFQIK
ncbi:MAG: gliding motility protein GldM [Aureispira sp.]|nr:gliding motility protein GldM [Aureispira sp.]